MLSFQPAASANKRGVKPRLSDHLIGEETMWPFILLSPLTLTTAFFILLHFSSIDFFFVFFVWCVLSSSVSSL